MSTPKQRIISCMHLSTMSPVQLRSAILSKHHITNKQPSDAMRASTTSVHISVQFCSARIFSTAHVIACKVIQAKQKEHVSWHSVVMRTSVESLGTSSWECLRPPPCHDVKATDTTIRRAKSTPEANTCM